jgi:hypothetical protein
MTNQVLVIAAFIILPCVNWPVAILLVRLSVQRPRIRSLAERALLAVLIAVVTTVYSLIVLNSADGYAVIDRDSAQAIIRIFFLALGLYPLWWLWAYWTDRFHD